MTGVSPSSLSTTKVAPRRAPRGQAADATDLQAPNAWLMLLEGRAPWESLALLASLPWLHKLPQGDGHPVLVFPGLSANDLTTAPLRGLLDRLGYCAQPWGQGLNLGPRAGVLERCQADLQALQRRHHRKVSLLGWSLGGLYARELAKQCPELVRSVITLGTPFTGHPRATNAWKLFEWVSGQRADEPALLERLRQPPPVPTTSIYSRSDGVVSWRCSVNEPGPLVENIEVPASHLGLGLNPIALYALADRLAQPEGGWQPFEPRGARRWFYRTPQR
ncbi:MAG: alpha/beta hydrolase [Roseateles depolymerans]|uniref:Alpha/beta hydrolase n=1 Tax=Roseateles depolymerans TaxID=76731 RepID=A0A2W5DDW0_9BURK|nr:MAG: alpha/beta hydrolase [Roseateles depolymerans]